MSQVQQLQDETIDIMKAVGVERYALLIDIIIANRQIASFARYSHSPSNNVKEQIYSSPTFD
jgi:hypothetical protein